MFVDCSVASLARDGLYVFRNEVAPIRIVEASAGCMTVQARLDDASIKIQNGLRFVTRRDIPTEAVVPGQRRLKQIILHLHEKRAALHASAHLVSNRIVDDESVFLQPVVHRSVLGPYGDHTA